MSRLLQAAAWDCGALARIAAEVVRLPVSPELQDVLLARARRKWLEGHPAVDHPPEIDTDADGLWEELPPGLAHDRIEP